MTDPGPTPEGAVRRFRPAASGSQPHGHRYLPRTASGSWQSLLGAAGPPQSLVGTVWLPDDSFCLFRGRSFDPMGEINTGAAEPAAD
jgi:hypothetical protein